MRADSAFYSYAIIAAARRAGARFSVTARLYPAVVTAITPIPAGAWTAIQYPNAIWDEDQQRWCPTPRSPRSPSPRSPPADGRARHRPTDRAPGPPLEPATVPAGQTEAFAVYRYHAVFTDSAEPMLAAEATHRDHAIIEQVIADLKDSALAHLPSGVFTANAAWLACAAIAHNLTRAAGALASTFHARARTATLRAQLINTPPGSRPAHAAHVYTYPALALDTTPSRPCTRQSSRLPEQRPPLEPPALPGTRNDPKWNSWTDWRLTHAHEPRTLTPGEKTR